ncbi:Sulfotransferase family protein [Lutibacter agarilyticus]|uniref:Sulfotransferase family protein n=1 Tax=Lutibacter agarilyticus TaxID=1109740 RepID=A0A238Y8I0_9FLAO|nr:sulfotransferase [Lutibacter agarilyticus]SNR67252.1 Sulfotransferase family protein [Lutibacter agarilyticus]
MKKKEKQFAFKITTLAGARFKVFRFVSKKYGVEKKYKTKWSLSGFVSVVATFFSFFDWISFKLRSKPKNLKDPVFILGHWRSGTTLLHNLMCLDPEAGYPTTYQTIFPNNLFSFQWLFKFFMKSLMPDKRPVDNVSLHVDYPQEEEFALNNETPFSYYNWWYFPKKNREIANEYLLGNTTKESDWTCWKVNFKKFVDRCLINTKGIRFISKNPPHTARIPQLLELYPNAKFIYIHRNPYEVVRSTVAFYKSILPATQLQDIDDAILMNDILWVYQQLIYKYEKDKLNIASENLIEIKYADLVSQPDREIQQIYSNLLKDDYQRIEPFATNYLEGLNHKLKTYEYKSEFLVLVNKQLSEIIKMKGYTVLS